jgi:hypothetical protein
MTDLDKPIKRRSHASRTEAGKRRRVIIILEPDQKIGFRLEGTRDTYRLDIESGYELAVRSHVSDVEKRTGQLKKTGMRAASARAQARKELKGNLR